MKVSSALEGSSLVRWPQFKRHLRKLISESTLCETNSRKKSSTITCKCITYSTEGCRGDLYPILEKLGRKEERQARSIGVCNKTIVGLISSWLHIDNDDVTRHLYLLKHQ